MNLKIIGKVLMSKSVGTGPSSYEKRIYGAVVSQRCSVGDGYPERIEGALTPISHVESRA